MIKKNIIDKVKSFPWGNVKSSFGSCKGVDEYLIGLSSNSSNIRDLSYQKLDNCLIVQGSLYEGAFYSIQFLIDYLHLEEDLFANRIYDLLFEIANGNSSFKSYIRYTNTDDHKFSPISNDIQSDSQHLPIACRYLILKHIDLYLEEIRTNSKNSEKEALALISSFDEFRGILIEPLIDFKNTLNNIDMLNEIDNILDEFIEEDGGIYDLE